MSNDGDDGETIRRTTEPTLLRGVVEDYGGYPGHAPKSEGQGDHGLLRIGFRDDEDLTEISWDEFVDEFEEKDLVGVYSEDGSGVEGDKPVVLRERDHADTDE
jgi:hypothetical protein